MGEASRTKRTLQNSRMAIVLFLVQIVVGFYSRKIFLDYLGAEVLGLNTTLGNILSFMNLAELGIGIAMSTSLYKPIHNEDHETICEIISVQGWLYRRVALLMVLMGMGVMVALPFIFPNTECGLAYVYAAFSVFLFGSIASYLWNYRIVLIYADQKNFRIMPWQHAVRYSVIGLQILAFIILDWGVWGWIAFEFLGSVMTILVINHVLKTEYPWLQESTLSGKALIQKYHDLLVKTKQLFVHKLGTFVLEQTTPLVIYAYVSLRMVTYYSNYMIIVGYVATSVGVIFSGMGASIGNLVAENKKSHTLEVFWELLSSRLWIAALSCYAIYLFIAPFITLWIGGQYVLSQDTLLLILVAAFIRFSRAIIDSFKDAYQLFADVWSPVVEASINLGGSILFGYLWGLNGILLGSTLSLVVIILMWKPYYLFRQGFKASPVAYYMRYVMHILIFVGCAVLCNLLIPTNAENMIILIFRLVPVFAVYAVVTFLLLYATSRGMRQFTLRIINLIKH